MWAQIMKLCLRTVSCINIVASYYHIILFVHIGVSDVTYASSFNALELSKFYSSV